MNPSRVPHATLILTGQVHALLMAVQAMAIEHPRPQAVRKRIEEAVQHGQSSLEWLPVESDTILEGYTHAASAVLKLLPEKEGGS